MGSYTVNTRRNGKHTVTYECAQCHAPLESPLEEAGQSFPCPTCGAKVQTPGINERMQQLDQRAGNGSWPDGLQKGIRWFNILLRVPRAIMTAFRAAGTNASAGKESSAIQQRSNVDLCGGVNGIHYKNGGVIVDEQTLRSNQVTIPLRAITSLRGCTVEPDLSLLWCGVLFILAGLAVAAAGFSNGFALTNVGIGVIAGCGFFVLGVFIASRGDYRKTFQILIAVPGTDGYAAVFNDQSAAQFFHRLLSAVLAGDAPHLPYAVKAHNIRIISQQRSQDGGWFIIWW